MPRLVVGGTLPQQADGLIPGRLSMCSRGAHIASSIPQPMTTATFLPNASAGVAGFGPEDDADNGELDSYQEDIERGRATSSITLAALPGMVQSSDDRSNFGHSGALSLKQTTALATKALRVKRKIRVKKARGDADARTPVQVRLD